MASFHPDDHFLNTLKAGISQLSDTINQFKTHDDAVTKIAEMHAKNSGAPAEQMDAHIYMHKQAIKKAMADHAKAQGQGGPGLAQRVAPTNAPQAGTANTGPNGSGYSMPASSVPQQGGYPPPTPAAQPTMQQQPMPNMPAPPPRGAYGPLRGPAVQSKQ